jgi:hypothetical protein
VWAGVSLAGLYSDVAAGVVAVQPELYGRGPVLAWLRGVEGASKQPHTPELLEECMKPPASTKSSAELAPLMTTPEFGLRQSQAYVATPLLTPSCRRHSVLPLHVARDGVSVSALVCVCCVCLCECLFMGLSLCVCVVCRLALGCSSVMVTGESCCRSLATMLRQPVPTLAQRADMYMEVKKVSEPLSMRAAAHEERWL